MSSAVCWVKSKTWWKSSRFSSLIVQISPIFYWFLLLYWIPAQRSLSWGPLNFHRTEAKNCYPWVLLGFWFNCNWILELLISLKICQFAVVHLHPCIWCSSVHFVLQIRPTEHQSCCWSCLCWAIIANKCIESTWSSFLQFFCLHWIEWLKKTINGE